MRALLLSVAMIAACEPDVGPTPLVDVRTNNEMAMVCDDQAGVPDLGGSGVPYRGGGTFEVAITVSAEHFATSTHATVEIVTSELVPGATLTGSAPLDDDGNENLAGTITLVWPRGGGVTYTVGVVGERTTVQTCLESPEITLGAMSSMNNGAQTSISACLDSSSSDGSVAVRLEGGNFADGATERTLPLVAGACDGSNGTMGNPRSHAALTMIAKRETVDLFALLPNSGDPTKLPLTVSMLAPLTLTLETPDSAEPLSIVAVVVNARRGECMPDCMPAAGIDLMFAATPAVRFVPAVATTDDHGIATVQLQKPAAGPVYVRVNAGDVSDERLIE